MEEFIIYGEALGRGDRFEEKKSLLPIVSVVMLTYNRPQYIDSAIASVRLQKLTNWELIVVQDGENSQCKDKISKWLFIENRIVYHRRRDVGSIGSAMNYAIQRSRGKYIAVLDDDDIWEGDDKLVRQIEYLESTGVAAVGGGAIIIDQDNRELMRYTKPLASEQCRRVALLANPLIHSTVLFRRSAYDAVDGYDEGIKEYQDWDFWLRMMGKYDVANLNAFFVRYRVWDGSSTSKKGMGNAISALRIVQRHRGEFRGYWRALLAALAYIAFALVPAPVRRGPTRVLSRLKKRLYSTSGSK